MPGCQASLVFQPHYGMHTFYLGRMQAEWKQLQDEIGL